MAGGHPADEYEEIEVTDDETPDPAVRQKELEDLVRDETRKAIAAKKAGDT